LQKTLKPRQLRSKGGEVTLPGVSTLQHTFCSHLQTRFRPNLDQIQTSSKIFFLNRKNFIAKIFIYSRNSDQNMLKNAYFGMKKKKIL